MSEELKLEDFNINKNLKLGSGYIANVYLAKHKKTKEKYAVKIINLNRVKEKEKIALEREVELHKTLEHPNIVKLFTSFEKDNQLYIILEFLEKGTLFSYM